MKYECRDQTVDRFQGPLLGEKNAMKLIVFGFNVSRGTTVTSAEGHVEVAWDEQVAIARAAEHVGVDGICPVGRWVGTGGPIDFNGRNYETMTWAAGLAAMTTNVQVMCTVHVPTVHPVRAAKQLATIDHISGGRLGLNIVAGWNERELRMFGLQQRDHDERYDVADEWIELMQMLWQEDGRFDFRGKYFDSPGAFASPKPVQKSRPIIMSAGISPRGRSYAARHADMIFISMPPGGASLSDSIKAVKSDANTHGNTLKAVLPVYVVSADSDREAQEYWNYYVHERGEREDAEAYVDSLMSGDLRSLDYTVRQKIVTDMIAGGATPLIGSPATIVRKLKEFSDAGVDGVTLSWVDYLAGLDHWGKKVMPALADVGLRDG